MGKKGDIRRAKVIESAAYCFTQFGERGATFEAIANHCRTSQATVVKHLKSRENIFPLILDYWIQKARKATEDRLAMGGTPEQRLRSYIDVSITIFKENPDLSKLYLTVHYLASFSERERISNTEIKSVAQKRIAKILRDGVADGSFRVEDIEQTAKFIHNSLVGLLISWLSEIHKPSDLLTSKVFENYCLQVIKK